MLNVTVLENGHPHRLTDPPDDDALKQAFWIDLEKPTPEERERVITVTGLHIPTEAEVSEIEMSARLASRDGVLYLNLPLINMVDDDATGTPGGFVLTEERLITIRFAHSRVFAECYDHMQKGALRPTTAAQAFIGLLEAIVDRQADALERASQDLEHISHATFRMGIGRGEGRKREDAMLRRTLGELGRISDLLAHIRETQLGVLRIAPYVTTMAAWMPKELKIHLATIEHDIVSLVDFDKQLSDKLQFLLDATLGFINIAQNNVMKVMAIASVVGIPPVLIAGVYGMNFKDIPELEWAHGYLWAWFLIILTTIIPLAAFRWRRWI